MVCPWHGSTFRLSDGAVMHGPGHRQAPAFDTQVTDSSMVQVRAAEPQGHQPPGQPRRLTRFPRGFGAAAELS